MQLPAGAELLPGGKAHAEKLTGLVVGAGSANNAGFHDLTRGLDDSADRALWPDELPLAPRRVDGL